MHQGKKYSNGVKYLTISALLIGSLLAGCAQAQVIGGRLDHAKLKDGTYEGSYRGGPNKASVQVTIKDSNIVHIEILQHQAWKGKKAEGTKVIP